jgi:hypothetical protein
MGRLFDTLEKKVHSVARTSTSLPHDFPDRALRDALVNPHNLRDLLQRVVPALVPCMDFSDVEEIKRSYLLDDWRRRDLDVLVRLKFRDASGNRDILICILVEHQSTTDPAMPLRLLLYTVLFWEQQWKEWEEHHERGVPLRLTPVLPVVLHTGAEAWDTNRSLADLFDIPDALRVSVPTWQTWMCDLVGFQTEELLASDQAWWQALAVLRAEGENASQFLEVLRRSLQGLESLGGQDAQRWQQLLKLVLYWALYRRPSRERDRVVEVVRASQSSVLFQKEIEEMAQQVEMNREQELVLQLTRQLEPQIEARVEARIEAQIELRTSRTLLRKLLVERFQTLPEEVTRQIDNATIEALKAAFPQVLHIQSPAELKL